MWSHENGAYYVLCAVRRGEADLSCANGMDCVQESADLLCVCHYRMGEGQQYCRVICLAFADDTPYLYVR